MIGFIGLSHLGLNYGLATAAKGFDVVCFDTDRALVGRLREGVFPIDEPGFRDLHARHGGRMRFTHDLSEIGRCELVFYALDISTDEHNESDTRPLTALIAATAPSLGKGTTAVVMSQVRPGFTRDLAARQATPAGAWYYQVETLIFGAAVQRAMEPERYMVGASEPGAPLPEAYRAWLGAFGCPLLVMRYESAELAKIAINFFLVSSVSTTNTLAELCEAIGADWGEIAPALRLDRRIGAHAYLKPGLGIAGGNLERDLVTVKGLAAERGTEAGIVDAWLKGSAHSKFWAVRVLERELLGAKPAARLAVWGLAYKQDTHSIKNSASIELIRTLTGCEIHAFDPVAGPGTDSIPNLTIHRSAMETLDHADALVVMTPWKEFSGADAPAVARRLGGRLVLDPYGVLPRAAFEASGLRLLQIGRA